ncbi:MAG: hypothetical protein JO128_07875 [Alphaproteobacteria bacterium]|nr:hypothetical protein [Alphaproteobacteria bacterium]
MTSRTVEAARAIRDCADVFALAADTMVQRGHAGDRRHIELLYAVFTSRLLPRPMCVVLKAPSSSGKSWLLNRTLELFPARDYELKSGITPKAIAYGQSDLRHRILAIQEASGLQGKEGNMLVRTLISEGLIRWEVTARSRGGMATRQLVRPGPIAFVLTTTHDALHREDETRALSIEVEETAAHTRRVLASIAGRYRSDPRAETADLRPWHLYQRWLARGPRRVAVPFADIVAEHFQAHAMRSKRDFEQALTAIAVSALMHRVRRPVDADGRVVASLDDYAMARRFLGKVMGEASGAAVPESVRETVRAILELTNTGQTRDMPLDCYRPDLEELAKKLGLDKASASRRVARAKELGYVVDERLGPPHPSRLHVIRTLPGDQAVLPEVPVVERLMRERGLILDAAQSGGAVAAEASVPSEPCPAPAPAGLSPPAAPRAMADIIRHAPKPEQADGGYRSRRTINEFSAAMEERRRGNRL